MENHLTHFVTSYGEVGSGVEYVGLLCEDSSDTRCHCKTDIGVDIDLTYSHGSCLSELLFGNTDSIRELAADGVDLLNVFLRNGGRTVENDREAGESLFDFFENIETERRGNENTLFVSCALFSSELVSAVRCTDRDSKRVNACAFNEFLNFFGTCVGRMFCNNVVFNACENAKFTFYNYAISDLLDSESLNSLTSFSISVNSPILRFSSNSFFARLIINLANRDPRLAFNFRSTSLKAGKYTH